MDKFDQAILDLLTQNSRQPVATIGNAIGLSRTAVNERINKLEKKGVIRRYTIEQGNLMGNQLVSAYFELTFRPFDLLEVKALLQDIPGIKKAHALSGTTDVLLFVEVPSMEQLNQIRAKLSGLPNLDKILTSTVLEPLI